MSEEYNGWTNWETWMVNLWITNDQGLTETAQEAPEPSDLKEWFEEIAYEGLEGFLLDCVSGVLSDVNWYEIHEGIMEGVEP